MTLIAYHNDQSIKDVPLLAHLEDVIFQGLPNEVAKDWSMRLSSVIQPGQDLSLVSWKFLYWMLTDETVNPGINHPCVKAAVAQVAQVILTISKGETPDIEAAKSAARSAELAESAARLVEVASALGSAGSAIAAAKSATWSAISAARSTKLTKLEISMSKSAGSAVRVAVKSVRSATQVRMADKLIELLGDAPIATQEPKP